MAAKKENTEESIEDITFFLFYLFLNLWNILHGEFSSGRMGTERGAKANKKSVKVEYFIKSKFSGCRKNIHHVQGKRPSRKCAYRGSMLMKYVCTRTISFRLETKTCSLVNTVHISFYLLSFQYPFRITIVLNHCIKIMKQYSFCF